MHRVTSNCHVNPDEPCKIRHTTYPGNESRPGYVALTVGPITFFDLSPANLFALSADCATAASELLQAEREGRAAERDQAELVAGALDRAKIHGLTGSL